MVRLFHLVALAAVASFLSGCATSSGTGGSTYAGYTQHGYASWYGSENGHATSSGERFNPGAMTAASRTLPFNTIVKVTNRQNGRTCEVRINDRGPWTGGRILDVSSGAADELRMKGPGVVPVEVEVVAVGDGKRHSNG